MVPKTGHTGLCHIPRPVFLFLESLMKTPSSQAACLLALCAPWALLQPALAQTPLSPKAQYAADSRAASTRYTSDKALCTDEHDATARLQCRRDAKAAYDKALSDARSKMKASAAPTGKAVAACPDCGRVLSVSSEEKNGESSPLGLIAGGAAGALLGNQVGSGTGKDLATIAGAVGGAYAGKKIEEKARSHTVWNVEVQFEDGSKARYAFAQDPGFKSGDAVRKSGNSVVR